MAGEAEQAPGVQGQLNLPCACSRLRKAARATTRLYDDALRPVGLRITQFNVLSSLAYHGPVTLTRLADDLVLERTTLARDLKPLERDGLITVGVGQDRRSRVVTLTDRGRALLDRAAPLWQAVQHQLALSLGEERLSDLLQELREVVSVTRRQ
ncbi:MarR family transcriptional regulator (plasmid) [Deinococcus aetherius]|uniref:MarR family transcriptional regulator n=1 Tax=Deinococcus aetherius TaxID=200252 RepID=A0ABN6RJ08_9DEIO|nr:MarR family winged helix-turn-helix transcriptional regulator [Deinococcus aetherius]BDP43288.1 MarR family transcriptional regulator [Deinococcus aetherius]